MSGCERPPRPNPTSSNLQPLDPERVNQEYPMDINTMLSDLLRVEGGYTNNPNDPGGETNYGITKAVAAANGYTGPMKDMPQATAKSIYQSVYFRNPGFDRVFATGLTGVAAELFEAGVNMGTGTATKFLQRALNALNMRGKLYATLAVDGVIGMGTISALNALIAKHGHDATESVLLKCLNALQCVHYIEIEEARPAAAEFMWGWISNRVGMPN